MVHLPATRRGFLSRRTEVTVAAGLFAVGRVPSGPSGTPASGSHVYDVTAFGARGDGKTFDTAAINQAIAAGVDYDKKLAGKFPYQRAYLPVNRKLDGTMFNW